jgi:hypothetical protein
MRADDALATLPDEPRWLEARAMLLGGAVPWAAGAGWVVADEAAQLLVASADADVASVRAAARGLTVLCAIERNDLADALRARGPVSRAVLHTLDDPSWLPDDEGAYPLPADADLAHLPGPLAAELSRALRTNTVYAAIVDGAPVSFAYAPWRTERWFDVSVDTAPGARQLGLATRVAAAMIRAERAAGREPVWGAAEDNAGSLRLAARLGFGAVDALWVASAG